MESKSCHSPATVQFAWFIYAPYPLKLGISPNIVEAIRERRTPTFTRDDERLVYDVTMELNTTRSLSDAKFNQGMAMFGEQKMVDLVSAAGFYAMVGMTLNAFDVAVPEEKSRWIDQME